MGFAKYIREHEYTNSVELDAYYPEPGAYINDNTNRSACWSAFQVDKNQYEVFL